MAIPASPAGPVTPAAALLALFSQVHDQLRDELHDVDDESLNLLPAPSMNPIAVILSHRVGSVVETLRAVSGVPNERNREQEFVPTRGSVEEMHDLLRGADDLIAQIASLITDNRLQFEVPLPTLPAREIRSGLTWLLRNYGHAREHVGQIQLTKQLVASNRAG